MNATELGLQPRTEVFSALRKALAESCRSENQSERGVSALRVRSLTLLLATVVVLAGCNPFAEESAAEAYVTKMFSAREVGETEKVLLMYDDQPDRGTPRERWSKMLVAIENKLGRPTSYKLTDWKVTLGANTAGSGTFVTLQYAVKYERAEGTETIVVFKPRGNSDFRIIGHNFNSPALLFDQESPRATESKTPTTSS